MAIESGIKTVPDDELRSVRGAGGMELDAAIGRQSDQVRLVEAGVGGRIVVWNDNVHEGRDAHVICAEQIAYRSGHGPS